MCVPCVTHAESSTTLNNNPTVLAVLEIILFLSSFIYVLYYYCFPLPFYFLNIIIIIIIIIYMYIFWVSEVDLFLK